MDVNDHAALQQILEWVGEALLGVLTLLGRMLMKANVINRKDIDGIKVDLSSYKTYVASTHPTKTEISEAVNKVTAALNTFGDRVDQQLDTLTKALLEDRQAPRARK